MCPSTLPPTPIPFFYSNTTAYDSNNNTNNNNSQSRHRQASTSSNSSADNKAYSFVSIPGMNQRKRPRRRYDEIERLYHCTFSGCKKSYGTLNHLNSHVLMQNHGPKRHPSEFKEMRKEWRRQRKQREEQRKQAEKSNKQQQEQQQQILQQHPLPPQQQQQLQPTLTTAFHPPSSYIPTNFPLQSMPLSGFY
ncbi:hypothetical protein BCR42DRAFT_329986 [Absidia repens]|uniref:C2H2-type domain-containing protein n=1 Tax=Absidia repens TaxID=90262 RepID=A0A1X2ID32_9FUNG|nr:hypothetical protein BCR42DRAFT_329986 [Absidia repens]